MSFFFKKNIMPNTVSSTAKHANHRGVLQCLLFMLGAASCSSFQSPWQRGLPRGVTVRPQSFTWNSSFIEYATEEKESLVVDLSKISLKPANPESVSPNSPIINLQIEPLVYSRLAMVLEDEESPARNAVAIFGHTDGEEPTQTDAYNAAENLLPFLEMLDNKHVDNLVIENIDPSKIGPTEKNPIKLNLEKKRVLKIDATKIRRVWFVKAKTEVIAMVFRYLRFSKMLSVFLQADDLNIGKALWHLECSGIDLLTATTTLLEGNTAHQNPSSGLLAEQGTGPDASNMENTYSGPKSEWKIEATDLRMYSGIQPNEKWVLERTTDILNISLYAFFYQLPKGIEKMSIRCLIIWAFIYVDGLEVKDINFPQLRFSSLWVCVYIPKVEESLGLANFPSTAMIQERRRVIEENLFQCLLSCKNFLTNYLDRSFPRVNFFTMQLYSYDMYVGTEEYKESLQNLLYGNCFLSNISKAIASTCEKKEITVEIMLGMESLILLRVEEANHDVLLKDRLYTP